MTDRHPDAYAITRVNMGDTPAPAIRSEAIYKTVDFFESNSPRAQFFECLPLVLMPSRLFSQTGINQY